MFDFSNYPDIAPAELRELMHEMDQSEPELDLEELTEWLQTQHAAELNAAYHAFEPALCLAHN
jgi:hypothetical protein